MGNRICSHHAAQGFKKRAAIAQPVKPWRRLLAERFMLRVHRETRNLDAYALVLAKSGGNPGPGLKRSTQDCSPEAVRALAGRASSPVSPAGVATPTCGARMSPGRLQVGGLPLTRVLGPLGGLTGRVVVDRTGLTGEWDFELTFAPDGGRGVPPGAGGASLPDPDLPSIFTAVQEQLGLKLEPTSAPVEVVVIDGADRPQPD
jgi:uncharacterized protein (TIGR03435 family)